MTCDCIDKVNALLAPQNTQIDVPILWESLRDGVERKVTRIQTIKLDDSKRGKPTSMFASCCPFCGVRYKPPVAGDAVSLS